MVDNDHDAIKDEEDLAPEQPPAQGGQTTPKPPSTPAPHSAALLVYTADLLVAVYQVESAMNAVETIGRDIGGYLSSRSDNQIVIRVPRERFQEALVRIAPLGDVLHRSITALDVTDQYTDLEGRLKNAYAMRDRLTELLRTASVKDALEIQKQLGQVTETIERLEAEMKLLKGRLAYSTITVTFQPVSAQSVAETQVNLPFPWLQELGLSTLMQIHQ